MSSTSRFSYHGSEPRLRIDTPADLAEAIVLNEQAGAIGQACLLRALMAARIAFLPLLPEMSAGQFKTFAHATRGRPAVTLIGDDDGIDRGSAGWRLAERGLRWARAIMLHAAGAKLDHYEAAIVAAELVRRALVIECSTATLPDWLALVLALPRRPPTLVIQPRGGVHPLAPDRSAMQ